MAVTLKWPFIQVIDLTPGLFVAHVSYKTLEMAELSDVHYSSVIMLDTDKSVNRLQIGNHLVLPEGQIDWDFEGHIELQGRDGLHSIGTGLLSNSDIAAQIIEIGKLSLRDVQHLSATCKSIKVSTSGETEHRLRLALVPYFPGWLHEISAFLREHKALISGSTILSILVPGNWKPNDLVLVLPERSSTALEALLLTHGYSKDPEREADFPDIYYDDYEAPTFRYGCFQKDGKKIDLCYIEEPSTPTFHVLKYHSTAVMNCYDGEAVYCYFPELTFAGMHFFNRDYSGPDDRREAGLAKLRTRGFVEGLHDLGSWITASPWVPTDLPTVWRQTVTL